LDCKQLPPETPAIKENLCANPKNLDLRRIGKIVERPDPGQAPIEGNASWSADCSSVRA
jgi:hypothetical protein